MEPSKTSPSLPLGANHYDPSIDDPSDPRRTASRRTTHCRTPEANRRGPLGSKGDYDAALSELDLRYNKRNATNSGGAIAAVEGSTPRPRKGEQPSSFGQGCIRLSVGQRTRGTRDTGRIFVVAWHADDLVEVIVSDFADNEVPLENCHHNSATHHGHNYATYCQ